MDKSKMLLIGCGKAGNALVNEMLNRDDSYPVLFVNSEYEDMAHLSNFKKENAFVFQNANGSGKDRNKALDYLKDQVGVLANRILNYKLIDGVTIFASADGGTGSGITPKLIEVLDYAFSEANESKIINLVAVMPSVDGTDVLGFTNAISFWNDIIKTKDILNDLKYIDNTKGKSYEEINIKATTIIDNSYDITGHDVEGDIDYSDVKTLFGTSKGYGIALTLPENCESIEEAIEKAKADSVFSLPNSWDCNYIAISLKKEDIGENEESLFVKQYSIKDVLRYMDDKEYIYSSKFATYNESHNTLVLTGVISKPTSMIRMIRQGLENAEERAALYESKKRAKDQEIDLPENLLKGLGRNNLSEASTKPKSKEDHRAMFKNMKKLF